MNNDPPRTIKTRNFGETHPESVCRVPLDENSRLSVTHCFLKVCPGQGRNEGGGGHHPALFQKAVLDPGACVFVL